MRMPTTPFLWWLVACSIIYRNALLLWSLYLQVLQVKVLSSWGYTLLLLLFLLLLSFFARDALYWMVYTCTHTVLTELGSYILVWSSTSSTTKTSTYTSAPYTHNIRVPSFVSSFSAQTALLKTSTHAFTSTSRLGISSYQGEFKSKDSSCDSRQVGSA